MRDLLKKQIYDAARYVELRQEKRAYDRAYYLANRPKLLANRKTYCAANPEKIKLDKRAYRLAHKQELRSYFRSYQPAYKRHRRATDPEFHILETLRRRVRKAIKHDWKTGPTLDLIGCTIADWKVHLEKHFCSGMNWKNYGSTWHIDHIKSCAKFDLTVPEQQKLCFHWSNTQPLFAEENLKKGAK